MTRGVIPYDVHPAVVPILSHAEHPFLKDQRNAHRSEREITVRERVAGGDQFIPVHRRGKQEKRHVDELDIRPEQIAVRVANIKLQPGTGFDFAIRRPVKLGGIE